MLANNISTTATVRNVFVIDDKGIIRVILVYPMNIGRNIAEILRIIEALQISDKKNAFTPANWIPGKPLIVPPPNTFDGLQERIEEIKNNKNGINWYLSFKNYKD